MQKNQLLLLDICFDEEEDECVVFVAFVAFVACAN